MSLQDELRSPGVGGWTSPNPVSSRCGIAETVEEENRKLAAENQKLRHGLFLLKENAELRTATLICQVIAWTDENIWRYRTASENSISLSLSIIYRYEIDQALLANVVTSYLVFHSRWRYGSN